MSRLFAFLAILSLALPLHAQAVQQPSAQWSRQDAEILLDIVRTIGAEGLDPADYNPERLRAAIGSGNPALLNSAAGETFIHLASDLGEGHVRDKNRIAWHIRKSPIGGQALMAAALAGHRIAETLASLSPTHPHYVRLKAELAATPARDKAGIERLRANLERWRWMPRDLGRRYILVNVPAFEAIVVEDGKITARKRIIVGKKSTPTPQFNAMVTGIILNPWWDVPQSIIAESVGRLVRTNPAGARARGYTFTRSGGRLNVRQRPGPTNALGAMKLVMPNPFTVYMHDTPNKELFEEEVRAFSHGCIRTQDALGFAALLLESTPGWDRAAIDRTVGTRATTTVHLARPLPVYVAYFTAAIDENGEVASYPDIYGRDGPVVAALIDRQVQTEPAP